MTATRDTASGALKDDEEVHTVNTDGGVVLDTKIDVLLDTETKVTGGREVLGEKLVLLNLQAALKNLHSLGATNSAVNGDLFVTTNRERTNSVAGLGVDGSLTGQVLEDLGSTSKTITGLTNRDVEAELGDLDVPHGVVLLGAGHFYSNNTKG